MEGTSGGLPVSGFSAMDKSSRVDDYIDFDRRHGDNRVSRLPSYPPTPFARLPDPKLEAASWLI